MTNIKVALTNLGQYNEGRLNYVWLDLPASEDEIKQAMKEIDIGSKRWDGGEYEEYFITDYEAPFAIGEYDSLPNLNDLAEELSALNDSELLAFNAYIEGVSHDTAEALDVAISGDYTIHCAVDDMADVARDLVDQGLFGIDRDSTLTRYIDYEKLGHDLSFDSTYVFIGYDCVEFYY